METQTIYDCIETCCTVLALSISYKLIRQLPYWQTKQLKDRQTILIIRKGNIKKHYIHTCDKYFSTRGLYIIGNFKSFRVKTHCKWILHRTKYSWQN